MSEQRPGSGLPIGLRVAQYGRDWTGLERAALLAERRGFASLWVNDHLRTPGRLHETPAFDAFTTLAALARVTRRIGLGTAVLSCSYRPAAVAAKMLGSVAAIGGGGRLTVGLGTGSDRGEHRAYGIPFAGPGERADELERTLPVIRAMFEHPDGATAPGLGAGAVNLPSSDPPQILVAANKNRLLAFAGREADGIVVAFAEPDAVARRRERALAARETSAPLRCLLYTYVLPIDDRRAAERWLRDEARALGSSPERLLRWLAGTGIVGDGSEIRERIADHRAAGVDEIAFVLPNRVPDEAIDALAEAVLPSPTPAPRSFGDGSPRANLVDLLVESHRRDGRGGDLAAVEADQSWDFDTVADRAARAADALAAAGVRRGSRVAILLPDGLDWVAATLGALWLGAVAVPLDPAMSAERAAEILGDCAPAAVIRPQATDGSLTPGDLLGAPGRPPAAVAPDDLAYLIYSSGSTGRPKAAMHAHADPAFSVQTYGREVLALGPGDRSHSVAGLFTSLGFGNGFFRPLGAGAAMVVSPRRPTVRAVLDAVATGGVTVLTGVPTFWSQLARFLDRHPGGEALASVRLGVSSGDSLPASVARRLNRSTGLDVLEGLGCSECSNTFISTRPGEPMPGLIGRPVSGVSIRLTDEDGATVSPGDAGRLWVRSPSNTTGYWRRRDLTRETVIGEWLRLGDVLREVEPGVYRHVGRTDARFKVDALWVNPAEVEAALLEDPAVAEAVALPQEDEHGLTRVVAVVVAAGDDARPDDGQLRKRVSAEAGRHAAPAVIHWRESLPRLPSGKLDRRGLAAELARAR